MDTYIPPIGADTENQVFYLQNMVKMLTKKFDDVLALGGIPGPQGPPGLVEPTKSTGANGSDGETPNLSNFVLRSEIFRSIDGNIKIGTEEIDLVKLGRLRFYTDGAVLHIADTIPLKEIELSLSKNTAPDVEFQEVYIIA
jgi:hypothetical protein